MSGLFAINKPSGISSAGLLNDLQNIIKLSPLFEAEIKAQRERSNAGRPGKKQRHGNKVKMGHGGTLDPLASGVLVVGTGSGTKELGKFLSCSKDYEAVALFGCSTDTYDSEGKVVKERPWKHITRVKLEEALLQFQGDIMQTPPIYSALKMQGKPLYEYAREGKSLPAEIKARPASVSKFEITKFALSSDWKFPTEKAPEDIVLSAEALEQLRSDVPSTSDVAAIELPETDDFVSEESSSKNNVDSPPPKRIKTQESDLEATNNDEALLAVHLSMTVSSGTYVRSLIHDLGLAIGSAAHMVALVRKRVGNFRIEDAMSWKDFEGGTWEEAIQKRLDFSQASWFDNPAVMGVTDVQAQASDGEALALEVDADAERFVEKARPFHRTLTYAQSLDAKLSGPNRKPLTISCPESFRVTHQLRRAHDIILIGVGTAINDNPGLNARDAYGQPYPLEQQPIPVVVDPSGRLVLGSDSKLMRNYISGLGRGPIQVVHGSRRGLCRTEAEVIYIDSKPHESSGKLRFLWTQVFNALSGLGKSIMIEGGASVIESVLQQQAADQILVTVAPVFVGDGTCLRTSTFVRVHEARSAIFGRDTVVAGKLK